MSAYKDTFEANTFEANSFACGTWRGAATAVVVPNVPGLEYRWDGQRLHYRWNGHRLHYGWDGDRLHYRLKE